MAFYAQVNELGFVTSVIELDPTDIPTTDGFTYIETDVNAFENKLWNTATGQVIEGAVPLRKNAAVVGGRYNAQQDAFIPPKVYRNWILSPETFTWVPPYPQPELSAEDVVANKYYVWSDDMYDADPSAGWLKLQPQIITYTPDSVTSE